jgi:hypothetical protein
MPVNLLFTIRFNASVRPVVQPRAGLFIDTRNGLEHLVIAASCYHEALEASHTALLPQSSERENPEN